MLTLSVVKSIQISLKLPQKQGGNFAQGHESLTGPQDKQTHSITPNGAVH